MKARSVVVGALAGAAMLLAAQVPASANLAWCVFDPPMQVVSPGGNNLTINTQVYLPQGATHLKNQVQEQVFSSSDAGGGTLVTVEVFVPVTSRVVATVNRWGVSAAASGDGMVTLYLHVPIS